MNIVIFTSILILKTVVNSNDMHMLLYNRRSLGITKKLPVTNLALQHHIAAIRNGNKQCYEKTVLKECPVYPIEFTSKTTINEVGRTGQIYPNMISLPLFGKLDDYMPQSILHPSSTVNNKLNLMLDTILTKKTESSNILPIISSKENTGNVEVTTAATEVNSPIAKNLSHDALVSEKFSQSLGNFERKFYETTFSKLSSISPSARRENGMSYVQSGMFLHLALMALSTEVDPATRQEIDDCLRLDISDQEKLRIINTTLSSLPVSSDDVKFRWSSRLVLHSQNVSERFRGAAAPALRLQIDTFNGTDTPKQMADALNHMVEVDSGGAIHNTFDEDELSDEVRAVLVNTLYMRARWRTAPTLLNGTRAFHEASGAHRATRMIRVNDLMRYAHLDRWDAEALEIFYSTPGLSLLLLVPRGNSLRGLVAAAVNTSLADITESMRLRRVAATLPLYTLRMTLLLPNKLQAMNISRLLEASNSTESDFRLSLAVQRIMFWAEAGRNAFKDDGLEWDEPPEKEVIVDRPYIFYVRWKNKTIMNGNFVL